jgi:hypothetical protein
MKLINTDVRYMLEAEETKQFNNGLKKFGIGVGLLTIGLVLASVASQYICEVLGITIM